MTAGGSSGLEASCGVGTTRTRMLRTVRRMPDQSRSGAEISAPRPRKILLGSWMERSGAQAHRFISERAQRVEGRAPARDAPIATDFHAEARRGAEARSTPLRVEVSALAHGSSASTTPKRVTSGSASSRLARHGLCSVLRGSAGRGACGLCGCTAPRTPRETPAQTYLCAEAEQLNGRARRTAGTRYCVRRPVPSVFSLPARCCCAQRRQGRRSLDVALRAPER